MVAPFEFCHASYARPVLQHLMRCFGKIILLTFRQRLFQRLNEDTLLIRGRKGVSHSQILLRDLSGSGDLVGLLEGVEQNRAALIPGSEALDYESVSRGRQRLINYLIPRKIRLLYEELKRGSMVVDWGLWRRWA